MIPKDNFWKQRRTLNSFCGKVAKFRSTLHFMGEFNSNTNILMLMQPTFEEKYRRFTFDFDNNTTLFVNGERAWRKRKFSVLVFSAVNSCLVKSLEINLWSRTAVFLWFWLDGGFLF